MSNPQPLPGIPWWINADIHDILKYIKVAATDISDPDTVTLLLSDAQGHLQVDVLSTGPAVSTYTSHMGGEDTSFTAGESPVVIDCNATLGRNAQDGYIVCDGTGDIVINISHDGIPTWGDSLTLKAHDVIHLTGLNVDQFRISHSGTNSAYRYFAI